MTRIAAVLASLAVVLAATSCEPCAGTSNCRTEDRISYTGHIVERATERSIGGVQVSFIRTGGLELSSDTLRATSGSDGFFQFTATAKARGDVTGMLRVAPPGRPAYQVNGITLHTTNVNGDGGDLGRIVIDPFVTFIGEIRNRIAHADTTIPNAVVTFVRTGGIAAEPEVIEVRSDAYGRFFFAPTVHEAGTLLGDIHVGAVGFTQTYIIPVRIDTRYQDIVPRDVSIINIGSALLWAGEIYRRATNAHTAGIAVDFQRTSGIAVDPDRFTTTTNEFGFFPIQPAPQGDGELVGSLTIHPPAPWTPFTVQGVRVHTTADDTIRLAGRWGYGAQTFGAMEFRYRTSMTKVDSGATIVFRRTGGIRTQPDTFTDHVNQFGFAKVELPADASGDVVGDIEVRLGEPYGTEIIRGQHLPSAEDDTQRFYGTRLVGRWFPQVGRVLDSATQTPIPGARVTFTRVDGIGVSPSTYVVTPNADGFFALRPQPLADGDVVGNITFDLPAPYVSVTIRGLHLQTSMDDTLRLVGPFFFARPH